MIERLLKSWIHIPLIVEWDFPLIVDSRNGVNPATGRTDAAPDPWSMLAQQAGGNFQADLQPEATEDLVLHPVRTPRRLVSWSLGDPLGDLNCLGLVERTALSVECAFKTARCTTLQPDVERARQDVRSFPGQFHRHAITYIGQRQQPGAAMREAVNSRASTMAFAISASVWSSGARRSGNSLRAFSSHGPRMLRSVTIRNRPPAPRAASRAARNPGRNLDQSALRSTRYLISTRSNRPSLHFTLKSGVYRRRPSPASNQIVIGCDTITAPGSSKLTTNAKSRSSALSYSTSPLSKLPTPTTCDRRLSWMRLIAHSDSPARH